jgi:hypothetical protein
MNTKNHMSRAQQFAVSKVLESVTEQDEEWIAYKDGWSDERVARDHHLTETQVASLRKAVFGKLRPGHDGGLFAVLDQRISDLELKVAELERRDRVSNYVSQNGAHIGRS